MTHTAKHFAERLNNCMDDMGAPKQVRERAVVLSKILDISKHQAWNLLEGHEIPSIDFIQRLAEEFEVEKDWFLGT